jgi:hypothetical protein
MPNSERRSVTSSVGTPLRSYGIAYHRVYGLSTGGFLGRIARGQMDRVFIVLSSHRAVKPPQNGRD